MKKTFRILALFMATVLLISGMPVALFASATAGQTTALSDEQTINTTEIFTVLNNANDFSTISAGSAYESSFAITKNVPDARGFTSRLHDWTSTVIDISSENDLYGVQAYAFYISTMEYYSTNTSFNIKVTGDDLAINSENRLDIGNNYTGIFYLHGVDGTVKSAYANAVNGASIPAGFEGYVIMPVVSENSQFNYNTFTKFVLARSGYPGWGMDFDGVSEAGVKNVYIDNVTAVFDLAAYRALKPYQINTLNFDTTSFDRGISVNVTSAGDTADITFNSVSTASSYKTVIYKKNGDNYYYDREVDSTATSAKITGLIKGEKYAVQILSVSSAGNIIGASYIKEFTAILRGNYNIMNDASDMAYISTTFLDGKTYSNDAIYPDGKGFAGLTTRGGNVTFINSAGRFDLAQYQAIAVYLHNPDIITIANFTDDSGAKVTDIIKDSNGAVTKGVNALFLNSLTGEIVYADTADWENGYMAIAAGTAGYLIYPINSAIYEDKTHIINEISFMMSNWHTSANAENLGKEIYIDNIALIDNLDVFMSDVNNNVSSLGFTLASSDVKPKIGAPVEINGESFYDVSWNSFGSAASYVVNVFEVDGTVKRTEKVSVTATTARIPVEYGKKTAVQVIALDSAGTPVAASKVSRVDGSAYVPEILGATFSEEGDIRFIGITPDRILTGYTVKGYGAVIVPEKFLNGELTLDTASAIKANFEQTPALGTQFYADVNGIGKKTSLALAARAYVTYIDGDGNEFTVYGKDTVVRSVDTLSQKMASAVLLYYDAKQKVTEYNESVTENTLFTQVKDLSSEDLINFAKNNRTAVSKAYDLIVSSTDTASKFNQRLDFVYVYETDNYTYGIDRNYNEVVSYKKADGTNYDVINGGGRYTIMGTSTADGTSQALLKNAGIQSFKQTVVDGVTTLTVKYATRGVDAYKGVMSTTYTFNENSVSVDAHVKYENENYVLNNGTSYLGRTFLNEYTDLRKTFHTDWIYPENGDYPYKMTDSWITIHTMDEDAYFYTFNRGNTPDEIWDFYVRYPARNVPLYFTDASSVDYTAQYDIVLRENENKFTADNEAVFASKDSDFTAYIGPVTPNDDQSTLFVGDRVDMAIDVKNIINTSNAVTTTYTVYDYYGNLVAQNNKTAQLQAGGEARYTFSVNAPTNPYGIYFVNLTVKSDKYTHTEFYTFAMLKEYTYKYNATSPFGIVQTLNEQHTAYENTWSIMNKIGIAKTRSAFIGSTKERNLQFLEKMKQNNMYSVPNGATKEEWWDTYGAYHDVVMSGNEINLATITGEYTVAERFDYNYENYFAPTRAIATKYGKKLALAGVSAGQTAWYDEFYNRGMWDDFDAIGLHSYGIPYAPDNESCKSYIWSVEGGLIRTQNAMNKYGKKIVYLDETGYHTSPNLRHVELRGQADYNVRCYILGTAYGCYYTGAYCFFDYSNGGEGTCLTDMEYHYGNFYYPDYYGRILPKVSGVALATMTRAIESVQTLTESSTYSGGTLRVFEADTAIDGKVYVAWSNCAKLKNDSDYSSYKRDPSMPWQNLWRESENLVITTSSKTVTVYDSMGNYKTYTAQSGKVTIPITGETVFIKGA